MLPAFKFTAWSRDVGGRSSRGGGNDLGVAHLVKNLLAEGFTEFQAQDISACAHCAMADNRGAIHIQSVGPDFDEGANGNAFVERQTYSMLGDVHTSSQHMITFAVESLPGDEYQTRVVDSRMPAIF